MRIVTRPDFDGIVCAVLLYEALDIRQTVKWVEPNALQRGLVDIRKGDIIANLPYEDRCSLWFDHHYRFSAPSRGFSKLHHRRQALFLNILKTDSIAITPNL
jgi:hypothetical protein